MSHKVSVIVPAYNAEKWIKASIASILNQSWKNVEVIVINDGSTDNTASVIKEFDDARLFYYCQENKGQGAASNFGLTKATGDYIKFFDADDLMNPVHIESQLKRLEGRSGCIASGAWGRFSGNDPGAAVFVPENVWRDLPGLEWLKTALSQPKDMMGACIWLIPRAIIEKSGGWDERLSLNNDFEFSCRLLLNAEMVLFARDAKVYYRSDIGHSMTKKFTRKSVEAMLLSNDLGCSYLLKADSSVGMRLLCANRFQDWVFQIYPDHGDITRLMEKKVKELGGSNIRPGGGKIFHLLKFFLGWKTVKRIQKFVRTHHFKEH